VEGNIGQLIRDALVETTQVPAVAAEKTSGDRTQNDLSERLVTSCVNLLRAEQPTDQMDTTTLYTLFLQVGRFDTVVAAILKRCGYSPVLKFSRCSMEDIRSACKCTVLYFTALLEELTSLLKLGNKANIESSFNGQWKEVLYKGAEELELEGISFVSEILAHEDVLDALTLVGTWKSEMNQIQEDAKKIVRKSKSIICGRRDTTEDGKTLCQLKQKLRKLQQAGDAVAETTLVKLSSSEEVDATVEEGEGHQTQRKRKKKKNAKSGLRCNRPKYQRQKGDELRLARKREIVACHPLFLGGLGGGEWVVAVGMSMRPSVWSWLLRWRNSNTVHVATAC